MGQKVSPIGMRVGIIRDWQSRWYADDKEFGSLLIEDVKIREFIENYYEKLSNAAQDKRKADPQISRIEIERTKNRVTIIVRTAHPGVVIGQDGKSIEGLKKQLEKMVNAGVRLPTASNGFGCFWILMFTFRCFCRFRHENRCLLD